MSNILLTQELVKSLFDYKDGFLYWKTITKYSNIKIGQKAGCFNGNRIHYTRIGGNKTLTHRIIFLWHHGYLPKVVDHKDRNCENNRIENLREATRMQNSQNRTSAKNSSSKYLGVHHYLKRKWHAAIRVNKILKSIGYFKTEEEAALAYNKAAVKYHGEFANLNIILQ